MSTARRNAKFCSTECTRRSHTAKQAVRIRIRMTFVHNQRRAARAENPGGVPFTLHEWRSFLKEIDFRCTYCGVQTTNLQMEHIVALSRGGPHSLANLTAACGSCNSSKRNRLLLAEWAPKRLGGKPRYDRSQPRGSITNVYNPDDFRGPDGPLPHIQDMANEWSELSRVINYSDRWVAQQTSGAADDDGSSEEDGIGSGIL